MDLKELQSTHKIYAERIAQWTLQRAVIDGVESIINNNLIETYTNENSDDFENRKKDLISFSYSESIVSLFSYFVTSANYQQNLGKISKENQWIAFSDDCDLWGTDFDVFLSDNQKIANIYGYCGILTDNPAKTAPETYPYISRYTPENILNWKFERDEYSRPVFTYLKLKDFEDNYLIWTPEKWERWIVDGDKVLLGGSGDNPLGYIPFVWHIGIQDSIYPYLGTSLIKNVARIDISIIKNLSQAENILYKSAFPIFRVPLKSSDIVAMEKERDITVGVSNVAVFDPETGQRPDWMPSEALNPVNAILLMIDRKITEIYRSLNLGSLQAAQNSREARSAEALAQEFQLLNIFLVRQGEYYVETKKKIIYNWLRWLGKEKLYSEIVFDIPQNYDVAALANELGNLLTAKTIVKSDTFQKEVQKRTARSVLPNLPEEIITKINTEIDGAMPTEQGVTPKNSGEIPQNEVSEDDLENGK